MILIPILLVLLVVLMTTTGLALRSRRRVSVVDREFFPAATTWPTEPSSTADHFDLFQNPQGNDLSLNDLMLYKLKLRYPTIDGNLNDYLEQFRKDHP